MKVVANRYLRVLRARGADTSTTGCPAIRSGWLTRRNRESICVALHPGTVDTSLSQPFAKTGLKVRPPDEAARDFLAVLDGLVPSDTGGLVDYRGQRLPF